MADTSKKFFIYNGTLDAFKTSAYPTSHTEKIVFIANGGNPVVFHKGMYIESAEGVANTVAGMKYFNGLTVDGKAYTLSMPTNLIINGTTDVLSVSVNESTGAITLDIASAFKQRVSTLETTVTTLATKSELDEAKADVIDQLIGDSGVDTKDSNTIIGAKLYADDKLNVAIGGANSALIGTESDSSTADTIWGAKKYGAEKASTAETNAKAYADSVAESAENNAKTYTDDEIADAVAESKVSVTEAAGSGSVLKSYTIKQGEATVGTINIPKDLVVTKGEIVEIDGVKNLQLTIANQDTPINIPVTDLVDVYTAGEAIIIGADNKISVNVTALDEELIKEGKEIGDAIKAAKDAADAAQGTADDAKAKAEANETAINTLKGDALKTIAIDEGDSDTANRIVIDGEDVKGGTDTALVILNGATTTKAGVMTAAHVTALNAKANSADVYTQAEVDEMFTTGTLA